MLYCWDCELTFDDDDIGPDWIDKDGTVWCPCGCEIRCIDLIDLYSHPVYDTLEEKYL